LLLSFGLIKWGKKRIDKNYPDPKPHSDSDSSTSP
jgi:hypothetical protein